MHVILFRKVAGLNQNDRPDFQEYAEERGHPRSDLEAFTTTLRQLLAKAS